MIYKYNLYYYNIRSNYKIHTLNEGFIESSFAKEIELCCKIDSINGIEPTITYSDSDFYVQFPNIIQFKHTKSNNTIVCATKNRQYLNEYITNAPFALLVAHDSGVLLHGATIIVNNKAYVFLAPCGGEKSTLLLSLLKEQNVWYYSDDAVALVLENDNMVLYKGSTKCKLKSDILQTYGISTRSLKQTSELRDKYYIEYKERVYPEEKCKLEKVFYLNRDVAGEQLRVARMDGLQAMPILLKGAVGYQNICQNDDVRQKIVRNIREFCPYMNVYRMVIPSNLSVFNKHFIDTVINC